MKLEEAWRRCGWLQAKLVINDPKDPLAWGPGDGDFGSLYMWTRGHTVPMLICQVQDEMPAEDNRELCICGLTHGFPSLGVVGGTYNLLWGGHQDDRWEPVNEDPDVLNSLSRIDYKHLDKEVPVLNIMDALTAARLFALVRPVTDFKV